MPATAVIQGGRAIFGMIGRKAHVDGFLSLLCKSPNSILGIAMYDFHQFKEKNLSFSEENRISIGEVKFNENRRNAKSEGSSLGVN